MNSSTGISSRKTSCSMFRLEIDIFPENNRGLMRAKPGISDFGVVANVDQIPRFGVKQDGYKGRELFEADGQTRRGDVPAASSQDVWALGKVLSQLLEVTECRPNWLRLAAEECQNPDPKLRPGYATLRRMLSP